MPYDLNALVAPSDRLPTVLVVGDSQPAHGQTHLPPIPQIDGFYFTRFDELDLGILENTRPDIVLSALFSRSFDALDLAQRLADLSFPGRYRAVSACLPDPRLIQQEVAHVAFGLDFDVFVMEPAAPLQAA